jgi:hypothetical protein
VLPEIQRGVFMTVTPLYKAAEATGTENLA